MVVLICNLHVGELWALLTRGSRGTQRETMFRENKYGREPPRTRWQRLSCREVTAQPPTSHFGSSYSSNHAHICMVRSYSSNHANMCILQKPQSLRQQAGCQVCSIDPRCPPEHKPRSETPDWIYICLSGFQDVTSHVWARVTESTRVPTFCLDRSTQQAPKASSKGKKTCKINNAMQAEMTKGYVFSLAASLSTKLSHRAVQTSLRTKWKTKSAHEDFCCNQTDDDFIHLPASFQSFFWLNAEQA